MDDLTRLATDIAGPPPCPPAEIVAPRSVAEVQEAVRGAASVVARGSGLSYSGGYQPARPGATLLDMRGLDRVTVHPAERVAVAEAGCTWAALDAALADHGLRLTSFGPLSGVVATIGGGLSQHAMFFGAGGGALVGDAVLGLSVVLADGTLLDTGALAGSGAVPFFRQIAPDLTGLFLGDAGTFGIKVRAAFRAVPRPQHQHFASFAFADLPALAEAQMAAAALGVVAECFGFDPVATSHLHERGFGIGETLAIGAEIAGASRNPVAALFQAAATRMAPAQGATLHIVTEGESNAIAGEKLRLVRDAIGTRGRPIGDTVPRATRARPFRRIRALLGPRGQNWLPVHGIVPASSAQDAIAAVGAFLDARAATFASHRIEVAILTVAAPGWLLIEPQFFWFDAINPFVRSALTDEQRTAHGDRAPDPASRAVVMEARAALRDLLQTQDGVHIQPGKYYPLAIRPDAMQRLRAWKAMLDPEGRMNPGALGLP